MSVALRGQDLTRSFGSKDVKVTALRETSLAVERGKMVLLMGPSGSGKSTLLAILSGLLRPDSGQVLALEQDLWQMSDRERKLFRLQHCGFIFQGHNLHPALTARQQLELVLRWGEGANRREAQRRAVDMLDLLGLGAKGHLRAMQLSGGEKQRVAIGRALIKSPAFCFADEPTSALDWAHGRQVVELLHTAARRHGATVLVVTHDARLIPYADETLYLKDGRLTAPSPLPLSPSGERGRGEGAPSGTHEGVYHEHATSYALVSGPPVACR
jgi:putative ABC transport system ATP-binding protein